MQNFIQYTPVEIPKIAARETVVIPGPLDQYLQNLQTIEQQEQSAQSEQPAQQDTTFRWSSSGNKEKPHTQVQSPTAVLQPTTSRQASAQQSNSKAEQAVQIALSKIGSPYVYGATGQNGAYDCSGLIQSAYKEAGVNVPRSTAGWLSSNKQTVGKFDGQPGDVIITGSSSSPSGGHARLITRNLGNGQYEVVEAKGRKYGVVTGTYTVGKDLKNIYRAKKGLKLIKKWEV